MRTFAEHQIGLSLPATSGAEISERQHLEQVEKQTKRRIAKLIPKELPLELSHIWLWYNDIKGDERLTCQEILAWVQLTGNRPTPFEVDCLRMLDLTYWKIYNDRNRKANSRSRDKGRKQR